MRMVNKMHDETISPFVEKHNRNEMRGGYMYVYRGYSNFLLNMAFISPSEVENIYIS